MTTQQNKWVTEEISVHVEGFAKPARVSAHVYGAWAVHAEIGEPRSWTVTHVRTGLAVRRGLRHKRRAQAVARALRDAFPCAFDDLSFGQKPSPASHVHAELREAIVALIDRTLADAPR